MSPFISGTEALICLILSGETLVQDVNDRNNCPLLTQIWFDPRHPSAVLFGCLVCESKHFVDEFPHNSCGRVSTEQKLVLF